MNKQSNWALLGGDSLLGKEVREIVRERKLPVNLQMFSAEADRAVLTAEDDEASVMETLTEDSLESVDVVLLAGSSEQSRAAMALAHKRGFKPVWIDLRGQLEDLPESRVRAPLQESEMAVPDPGSVQTIAHPAASLLARFFELIHRNHPVRRAVVTAIEPVSVQDQKGVDELHKQTVSLLSFQSMPQAVFDTQVAFNILPRYGIEATARLEASERRLERHLASLLGPKGIPLPSLRLIHAPVFHGYCFLVWVEFDKRPPADALQQLLSSEGVDYRSADVEPPSNLAVAGSSGITVGDLADDPNDPRAAWFFVAGDNLRTLAENGIMVAGLAKRKSG